MNKRVIVFLSSTLCGLGLILTFTAGYFLGKRQESKKFARYVSDARFGAEFSKPVPLRIDKHGNMVFEGNKLIGGAACINPDKELGCASKVFGDANDNTKEGY